MLPTIATIKTKAEATGKLPPFTAKVREAIEIEAVSAAEVAMSATGVEAAAVEPRAYKGERVYNGLKMPWAAVTFVEPTGTKAAHIALAEACKAAGVLPSFARIERLGGFESRVIPLFYPFTPGEL